MGVLATVLWLAACGGFDPPHEAAPEEVAGSDGWTVIRPAVRDRRWEAARCNDGTPASVAVRRSPSGSATWVVRVVGGFYCDEVEHPCAERPRRFTTGLAARGRVIPDGGSWPGEDHGLFSTDPQVNPTFWDANHALLWYCSSDLWLGASTARQPNSASAEGWYFSGRQVLRADLEALSTVGLDPADPRTEVLIVGESAGGIGLASNLDTLRAVWPRPIAAGRVKAVVDGGWVIPLPEWDPTRDLNRWGGFLPACEADRRAAGEDPQDCVLGGAWLPYWEAAGIGVLVAQSGLDTPQVTRLGLDRAQRLQYRDRVRADLEQRRWVVSGGFAYHLVAFDPRREGTALWRRFTATLDRFWRGGEPERVFLRYNPPP